MNFLNLNESSLAIKSYNKSRFLRQNFKETLKEISIKNEQLIVK